MPRRNRDAGVYLLANDRFLDWTRALLKSLAVAEPGLPVTVIPYDPRSVEVVALARAAGHDTFHEPALLRRLDDLATDTFAPRPGWVGAYRKLAAFAGVYERFLVLDADVLITGPLRPVLGRLGPDCQVQPAHHSALGDVWREGPLQADARRLGQAAFNSGMWAGVRDALGEGDIVALAAEAAPLKAQFASRGDQSFFNFCLLRAGLPARAWNQEPEGPQCAWAGDLEGASAEVLPPGTAAVHWAGFRLSPLMPLRRLWLENRLRGTGPAERASYLAREPLRLVEELARRFRDAPRTDRR